MALFKAAGFIIVIQLVSGSSQVVAVGMVITDHPPHRSGRALLTHPAPTSGIWRKSVVPDKDVQS